MKFAQAWVIEFEQRSKGSAAGFVGLAYIDAAIRVVCRPYPLRRHKTALGYNQAYVD
ncbi:hypothetical protein BDW60DRAFT_183862 [Aspergillus nidulans var. acristatus]